MQVLQDIYNELTGKSETLSKTYDIGHNVDFQEIRQLNNKIEQLFEQYHIVSKQCSAGLYFVDDSRQQYSSFERFQAYDGSSNSPVENVTLQYDFLLLLPQTTRTQNYTLKVNITSRAAFRWRMEQEGSFPRGLFSFLGERTIELEIQYVDYAVARTFFTAADEWARSLEHTSMPTVLKWAKRFSDQLDSWFRLITTSVVLVACLSASNYLLGANADPELLYLATVGAIGALMISGFLAFELGRFTEHNLEKFSPASSLHLSRGDQRAYDKFKRSNTASLWFAGISLITAFGINIVAAAVAWHLGY